MKPETIEMLWTSQRTKDGEPTTYGIGWHSEEVEGQRVVYHTGGATGGSDVLVILPNEEVVVAILTNLSSERPTQVAIAIANLFDAARR